MERFKYIMTGVFHVLLVAIFGAVMLGLSYGIMKACDDGQEFACQLMED